MLRATLTSSTSMLHLDALSSILRAALAAGVPPHHDVMLRARAQEAELARQRDLQKALEVAAVLVGEVDRTVLGRVGAAGGGDTTNGGGQQRARVNVDKLAGFNQRLKLLRGQLLSLKADVSSPEVGAVFVCARAVEKELRAKRQALHSLEEHAEFLRKYLRDRQHA
jgi:hypothetical protein